MAEGKAADAPSWLHRVEEDEMRTLVRASANYARQGYDPALATLQKKAITREAGRAGGPVGAKGSKRRFENDYIGSVPTHYKNFATGRVLTTAMPVARPPTRIQERAPSPVSAELRAASKQAIISGHTNKHSSRMMEDELLASAGLRHADALHGLHPSRIPLTRTGPQTTYHSIDAQTVVLPPELGGQGGVRQGGGKSIQHAGLSKGALAALDDAGTGADGKVPKPTEVLKRYKLFNARAQDEGQGQYINSMLNSEARHGNVSPRAIGPGTVVIEGRSALSASGTTLNMHPPGSAVVAGTPGLPAGAASHAILQNRLGKAGVTPGEMPRGGSGLVVGNLLISYEQLIPATLVSSKWGRVSTTHYSDVPTLPCKIGVEVQPLYYESFLMDLHAVLDRSGGYTFEPLVSPGAFVVDFGRVNAHVHGHARPEPLESKAGQAILSDSAGGEERVGPDGEPLPEPPGPGAGNTTFSLADVGFGGTSGSLEVDTLRAARQRVAQRKKAKAPTREDVLRAELSMAIDNSKEQARLLLLKLAADGADAAVDKLLADGLRVDWAPDPWHAKQAEKEVAEAAARGLPPPPGTAKLAQKDIFVQPEVETLDVYGNSALMLACKNGWVDVVLCLLRHGADHKRRNENGQSALDLAKMESNSASVALSVNVAGAAQRKRRAAKLVALLDDRTVLVCAQKGDTRRMNYLVDDCGHPVNAVNQYGMTPLHFAVLRKDAKMATFLRERGADLNARNNLGQSPLSLVLDMGKDRGQKDLLAALDVQDVAAAEGRAHALAMEEEQIKRHMDEERLVSKLKTYTKGTTAARAVYAALGSVGKAGTTANFSASAAGGAAPHSDMKAVKDGFTAPALSKTIGLVTSPMGGQHGGRGKGRASSPSHHPGAASLGPIKFKPITASERRGLLSTVYDPPSGGGGGGDAALRGSSKGLAESWSRHVSNYIAVAEKQQHALDSRKQRAEQEATDLAGAEIRAGRLNPADSADFVKRHVSAGGPAPSYTGSVSAAMAVTDPKAMINAEHGLRNVEMPPAESARFEAWARMRFGVA